MSFIQKIGLGGGCHWCTEAIFQSLIGVKSVAQGFITSNGENNYFSEAVIVSYDSRSIEMKTLIEIHLHTHKSTSMHSMRAKYRSAIYTFTETDTPEAKEILMRLQNDFETSLIIKILPFVDFKPSNERFHNYYYSNKDKPFCSTYISPKLKMIMKRFSKYYNY